MAEQMQCYVVCTDETGRYETSVEAAIQRAANDGARVILYDVSAPGSPFSAPRPNEWAGEGQRADYDHPLDPVALEQLGRHTFALQVMRARANGVDAYGWLPDKSGGAALAEYAAREHADLVLIPDGLEDATITDYFAAEGRASGVAVERV